MTAILAFINGKKTYILVALGLTVQSVNLLGYLDESTSNTILAYLGLGTIATLRAGIAKLLTDAPASGATPPAQVSPVTE